LHELSAAVGRLGDHPSILPSGRSVTAEVRKRNRYCSCCLEDTQLSKVDYQGADILLLWNDVDRESDSKERCTDLQESAAVLFTPTLRKQSIVFIKNFDDHVGRVVVIRCSTEVAGLIPARITEVHMRFSTLCRSV